MFGFRKKGDTYSQEQRDEVKELTGREKIPKVGSQNFREMIEEVEALKPSLARELSEAANGTSAAKGVHAKELGRLRRRSRIVGWFTSFFSREDSSGKTYTTLRPVGFVLMTIVGLVMIGIFSYYGKLFGPTVVSVFTGPPDPSVEAQLVQPSQQVSAPTVPLESVVPPDESATASLTGASVPTEEPQPLQETNFAASGGSYAPRAAPPGTPPSAAPSGTPASAPTAAAQPPPVPPMTLDRSAAPSAMSLDARAAPATASLDRTAPPSSMSLDTRAAPATMSLTTADTPTIGARDAASPQQTSRTPATASATPHSSTDSEPMPRFLSQQASQPGQPVQQTSNRQAPTSPRAAPAQAQHPEPSQRNAQPTSLAAGLLQPGRRLSVRLVTGVLIVPGASVPVAVETLPQACATPAMCPKITFLGTAELLSLDLVRFSFDRAVLENGEVEEIDAVGLDMSNNPSVRAAIIDSAPAALPDLVRGSLGAFSDYVDALTDSADITVTEDAVLSQSRTPGLGSFLAAAASETFSFQDQTTAVVRTASVPAGTPLQVISGLSY